MLVEYFTARYLERRPYFCFHFVLPDYPTDLNIFCIFTVLTLFRYVFCPIRSYTLKFDSYCKINNIPVLRFSSELSSKTNCTQIENLLKLFVISSLQNEWKTVFPPKTQSF